ncbi:PucR family transcriptional regulator ligand-binding domain-containing protein [Lachnospiraceae bacterium 54-53]
MPVDIRWLIHNSSLKNLSLLTCEELIDSPITSVNVLDNPEVIQWMKPGELVLTTGYVFAGDPELQSRVLRDLKAAGCSALCIKTRRFFEVIPEHMLKLSRSLQLPVIELPYHYSLSEVARQINDSLYQEQFQDVLREQAFYNQLFNAYFEKKHTSEILDILSDYLGKSVLLMNSGYECEWFSLLPEDSALLNPEGELLPSPKSLSGISQALSSKDSFCSVKMELNQAVRGAVIFPFRNRLYYLAILTEDAGLLPIEILKHAIRIMTFSGASIPKASGNFYSYYDPFFQFLLNGPKHNELEDNLLFHYYGFPHKKPRICLLLSKKASDSSEINQSTVKTVNSSLKELPGKSDSFFTAWNLNNICIYLFGAEEMLTEQAQRAAEILKEETGGRFLIGISRTSQKAEEISQAYKEASFMLMLAAKLNQKEILFFSDYLTFWMIHQLSSKEQDRIYKDTVKALADYDEANHSQLMQTLTAYFECGYNSTQTAEKLYIHRNTFIKRMNKIRELIRLDPEDSHLLSSVYCGLCVYLLNL